MTSSDPTAPGPGPIAPMLVLGLDGATFDVIRPMVAAGKLPNLARWMVGGSVAPLRSTTPPVTFPAWSSFTTGLEPGRHGLFDFTQKLPGAYRICFVNSGDRHGTTLFRRICDAGGRVLALGVPATFPPEPLNGFMVPGFDAPVSTGSDAEATNDPSLYREIEAKAGPWMRPALKETGGVSLERSRAHLLDRIERKTAFALASLEALRNRGDVDFMMIVYSESDTVGHHFWRHHDPASPRHDPSASAAAKGAIEAVYSKLDEACGQLREAFGEEALCVVMSDHGMGGAGRHVVHLNGYLRDRGLLRRNASARGPGQDGVARNLRDLALRILPARLAQEIFRRARSAAARIESTARFGGFDWSGTLAFSEEANTNPGVWINLRGRETKGCVAPEDYEATREKVIEALLSWRLPNGEPVVARAVRREEVFSGPHVDRAPDVMIELALDSGYGVSLVSTKWNEAAGASVHYLADDELAGGRGLGMNGTHRSEGIFIGVGSETFGAFDLAGVRPRLVDMAPTLLEAMGVEWQEDEGPADGKLIPLERRRYTDEEEAIAAERLRALGYLE